MELALLLLALVGHGYLWAAFFNHTHSTALPRWIIEPSTAAGFACAVLIPLGLAAWYRQGASGLVGLDAAAPAVWLGRLYLGAAWFAGVATTLRWGWHRLLRPPPAVLLSNRTRPAVRLVPPGAASAGEAHRHFLVGLPGNEILRLEVAERAVEVPRLPRALDRLAIVHLSDLHFSGRIEKRYFEEVVRRSNELEPDLVAITGDMADCSRYIEWIPDTLGRLTSRWGIYYVLGNHDVWIDTARLRRTLADCGLIDLGSRWTEAQIRGRPVILAGNELPWILPAADLEHAPPRSADRGPPRIVLAHCPDQLPWARANDVDLLLAGHTHGGQIRIPAVGPLLSASRLGVAYCSGVFHVPPTIMHVTRGVSARHPVRFNCPPELVKLVLRAPLPPKA